MLPVRCYTCNTVIGQHENQFKKGLASGEPCEQLLKTMGINRMCCRRMLLGFVDLSRELESFPATDTFLDSGDTLLRRRVAHTRVVQCD